VTINAKIAWSDTAWMSAGYWGVQGCGQKADNARHRRWSLSGQPGPAEQGAICCNRASAGESSAEGPCFRTRYFCSRRKAVETRWWAFACGLGVYRPAIKTHHW